jgi:hypothetical protein
MLLRFGSPGCALRLPAWSWLQPPCPRLDPHSSAFGLLCRSVPADAPRQRARLNRVSRPGHKTEACFYWAQSGGGVFEIGQLVRSSSQTASRPAWRLWNSTTHAARSERCLAVSDQGTGGQANGKRAGHSESLMALKSPNRNYDFWVRAMRPPWPQEDPLPETSA